ncbi:MAG: metal-sensing transcriptional repressor [Lachnospiraceae bacterium]|nr:metal-sensing transcriptional repressor [Lachnospiraceae bacterium]
MEDAHEVYCDEHTQNPGTCGHYKLVPRDALAQKQLQNRINRIIGQLNGIRNMIGENRYCGDILIQIGAVESALQSLGYIILQEHMQTCVVEEVKKGNEAIMEEAIDLIKKLK